MCHETLGENMINFLSAHGAAAAAAAAVTSGPYIPLLNSTQLNSTQLNSTPFMNVNQDW